jgi:hypothetical protein
VYYSHYGETYPISWFTRMTLAEYEGFLVNIRSQHQISTGFFTRRCWDYTHVMLVIVRKQSGSTDVFQTRINSKF